MIKMMALKSTIYVILLPSNYNCGNDSSSNIPPRSSLLDWILIFIIIIITTTTLRRSSNQEMLYRWSVAAYLSRSRRCQINLVETSSGSHGQLWRRRRSTTGRDFSDELEPIKIKTIIPRQHQSPRSLPTILLTSSTL